MYWITTVIVVIGCWGAMLVYAAAVVPQDEDTDYLYWILQYNVGLFIFSQVCYSARLGILLWLIAHSVVYLGLSLFEHVSWHHVNRVMTYPAPLYLLFVYISATYSRSRLISRYERLSALRTIASNIAHELRTPLSGIGSSAFTAQQMMGSLIDGYHKAKSSNLEVDVASTKELDFLSTVFKDISEQVTQANTIIDHLLTTTGLSKVTPGSSQREVDSLNVVRDVLQAIPCELKREDLSISHSALCYFKIEGSFHVVKHIFLGAFFFSLNCVKGSQQGVIDIWSKQNDELNAVILSNNGPIITFDDSHHLFDESQTSNGQGLITSYSLQYCKRAIEAVGGKISFAVIDGMSSVILEFPSSG